MTAQAAPSIRILSIATLFPDRTRPNFGIFVENSLRALARQPGVSLTVVSPLGLPPWPLGRLPRYRELTDLPVEEEWRGLRVLRPRFTLWPGPLGPRCNPRAIASALLPLARGMQAQDGLDVIDAQFFHPDGPAAHRVAGALSLPFSIKARGADISLWARRRDSGPAVLAAARAAGGLLAVADSLRDDMVAAGMPRDHIAVHYTGLDTDRFRPLDRAEARRRWNVEGDGAVLLTVGALIPRKGQERVIEALRLLPADTRYLVAGVGPDREKLQRLARQAGLSARVRLIGPVANADLPGLYAAADAVVSPSVSEGLANAWVEASGCGAPLVLSDIPPAREMIDSPAAGRIARPEPAALAAAIRHVLAAPPDREKLAAHTRRRFDWERNGRELAAHLRQVAGK